MQINRGRWRPCQSLHFFIPFPRSLSGPPDIKLPSPLQNHPMQYLRTVQRKSKAMQCRWFAQFDISAKVSKSNSWSTPRDKSQPSKSPLHCILSCTLYRCQLYSVQCKVVHYQPCISNPVQGETTVAQRGYPVPTQTPTGIDDILPKDYTLSPPKISQ